MRKNYIKHKINWVRVWPLKKNPFRFLQHSDITLAYFSTSHIIHIKKDKITKISKGSETLKLDIYTLETKWIHENLEVFLKDMTRDRKSYGKIPLSLFINCALPLTIFKSGIYMFTNKINKKKYVGKSKNLFERFKNYNWQSKDVTKYNTNINRAFSKYGLSNFSVTLLEYCKEKDLGLREQHYIDKIKPQYNIRKSVYNPKEKIVAKKTEEKPKLV